MPRLLGTCLAIHFSDFLLTAVAFRVSLCPPVFIGCDLLDDMPPFFDAALLCFLLSDLLSSLGSSGFGILWESHPGLVLVSLVLASSVLDPLALRRLGLGPLGPAMYYIE